MDSSPSGSGKKEEKDEKRSGPPKKKLKMPSQPPNISFDEARIPTIAAFYGRGVVYNQLASKDSSNAKPSSSQNIQEGDPAVRVVKLTTGDSASREVRYITHKQMAHSSSSAALHMSEIVRFEDKCNKISDMLDQVIEFKEVLEPQLAETVNFIAEKEEKMKSLETEIIAKSGLMIEKETEIANLKLEVAKKDEKIVELQLQVADNKVSIAEKNLEIEKLQVKVAEKDEEIANLKKRMASDTFN